MIHSRLDRTVAGGFKLSAAFLPLIFPLSIFLAACASAPPVVIGNDHPANPAAERGYTETPAALATYKSPADFAAQRLRHAPAVTATKYSWPSAAISV